MKARKLALTYGVAALAYRSLPALAAINSIRRRAFRPLCGYGDPTHIALTFDDGPDPLSTPLVLRELDRLGVRATFFLLGSMVEVHPYLVGQIEQGGHEIGLHGQWHRNHLFRSSKTIHYDLERGLETLRQHATTPITHFRPPYGVATQATLHAARGLGLKVALWSTWGRDWRRAASPTSVYRDVLSALEGGGTILLHDADCTSAPGSFNATLGSLPMIARLCEEHSWQLGPLREHGF
ncbi:MAG: polysaccharide deacetylase family protein [Acidimicrobiales bacterium]